MTQSVNRGTTSTRRPSAGQIEKVKAVSMPPKQPVLNGEEIRIMCVLCSIAESMLSRNSRVMGRSGAGKSSVCKRGI